MRTNYSLAKYLLRGKELRGEVVSYLKALWINTKCISDKLDSAGERIATMMGRENFT